MPIQSCKENGKSGKKYGKSGECYTGPDAEKKAGQQAAAIHAAGYRGDESELKRLANDIDSMIQLTKNRRH